MPVDQSRVARAVRELLEAIGEDPNRDGLRNTPDRVARMFTEIFRGTDQNPADVLNVTFESGHDEAIIVKDIPLYSICEHHLVPFIGRAHVAYIPNTDGRITGLSKLARLVDVYARRLQVQENLTTQIADAVEDLLEPRGVLVSIEAEHLCMAMRGVQKSGTTTITNVVRGLFRDDARTRAEAMALIR